MVFIEFCTMVKRIYSLKIKHTLQSTFQSDLFRNVAGTFITKLVLIVIGLLTTVTVTHVLGPEGRGFFAVATTIMGMGVQFGNLGIHASNTYTVSQDYNKLSILMGNSLMFSFIFGGVCAIIAWIFFLLYPEITPIGKELFSVTLIWIPIGLAYLFVQNLLIGIYEFKIYNLIEIVVKLLNLTLISLVIVLNNISVENIFSMGLISMFFGLIWVVIVLYKKFPKHPKISIQLFVNNITYGFKAYLAALFSFMVLRIDLIMIQYMLGPKQAGYYSISATMADMVYMLPVVVGTVLFPKLSALSDVNQKWAITRKIAFIIGCVMLIIILIATIFAKYIITILFGNTFIPAVSPFIWLMPGIFMLSINTIYMNYFASMGMPNVTVYAPGLTSIVNILLNFKLINLYGIEGASLSSCISYGMMLFMSYLYQRKRRSDYAETV